MLTHVGAYNPQNCYRTNLIVYFYCNSLMLIIQVQSHRYVSTCQVIYCWGVGSWRSDWINPSSQVFARPIK